MALLRGSALLALPLLAEGVAPLQGFLRRRRGVPLAARHGHDAASGAALYVAWCANCSADELAATQLQSAWGSKDDPAVLAAHSEGDGAGHDFAQQVVEPLSEARSGLLMASLAGAATLLGAAALPCLPPEGPPPPAMAFTMSLAAGVMVAVALEMLAPGASCLLSGGGAGCVEAVGLRPVLLAAAGGAATLVVCRLADMLHPEPGHAAQAEAAAEGGAKAAALDEQRSRRLAFLLFVSLTAHNIPEGFAVAVSAHSSRWLGASVAIAVTLHNIPEGVTLAVATFAGTKSRLQAVIIPAVAGLAEPLGALVAVVLLQSYITAQFVSDMLAAVAGVMCVIAVCELLPEAASTRCWAMTSIGFFVGMSVMLITHLALEHAASGEALAH